MGCASLLEPREPRPARAAEGSAFEKIARGAVTGDLGEALEEVQTDLEEQPANEISTCDATRS